MITLGVSDVYDAASLVLTKILSAAEALSATLPDRQMVNTGGLVYDCACVAVTLISSGTGIVNPTHEDPGNQWSPRDPTLQMTVGLTIVRCATERPTGRRGEGIPTVEMIVADGVAASSDAAVLNRAISELVGQDGQTNPEFLLTFNQTEGGFFAVSANLTFNPWLLDS